MNILIVGPYPPPIGGNSVHVQRLLSLLKDTDYDAKVLDVFSPSDETKPADVMILSNLWYQKLFDLVRYAAQTDKDTIVHFHVSGMRRFKWIAPILIFLFFRQRRMITIHSGSFVTETSKFLDRYIVRILLGFMRSIIVVNSRQADFLESLGLPKSKITVIPAFLPQHADLTKVPIDLQAFDNKTVIITSGYLTPLYNYDVIIDCMSQVPQDDFHFIFAFYHTVDEAYREHIETRLQDFKNVTVLNNQSSEAFLSLLNNVDIYIRSTLSDGDAVAIREALSFNKIVFASDSADRPQQCYIFNNNDSVSLMDLFERYIAGELEPRENEKSAGIEKIKGIYEQVAQ